VGHRKGRVSHDNFLEGMEGSRKTTRKKKGRKKKKIKGSHTEEVRERGKKKIDTCESKKETGIKK